nr:hypothetical protein [Candidatus Njordarchaeota archaeon]
MLKGLLVIQESGTPIYTFFTEKVTADRGLLISGFLTAMQAFASETSLSPDGGNIHSIKLSQSLLTFRLLNLQTKADQPIQYYFVLLTDIEKKQTVETEALLEYLILNFLSYEGGEFRRKMREFGHQPREFEVFDELARKIVGLDWKAIKKKIKPVPGSLLQGVLNEIRDYLPLDQILQLHPKIVRIGSSYAWLSDDLPKEEEKELLNKIKKLLSHMFGEDLYESIVEDVSKQLSGERKEMKTVADM